MGPKTEGAAELAWLDAQIQPFQTCWRWLMVIALSGLGVTLALYAVLAWQVDALLVSGRWPGGAMVATLAGLVVLQWALSELKLRRRQRLAARLTGTLATALFRQGADKGWVLLRSCSPSAWYDLLTKRLMAVEHYLIDYRLQRRLATLLPIFILAIVLPISWLVALILFITLPLMPLFMWIVGVGAAEAQRRHFTALDRLGAFFIDRLRGAGSLWVLNRSESQYQRFRLAHGELERRTSDVVRLAFLSASVLDFLATLSVALVAVYIGFSLLGELNFGHWDRPLTLGTGLFLLLLTPAFFAELKIMGRLYHARADALAAAERLRPILQRPLLGDTASPQIRFDRLETGHWQVMGYEGNVLIEGDDLHLHRGDRVWLQGPSGSGKSALLDALAGRRPIAGDWHLNGRPVTHLKALTDSVAMLAQRPVILPGTIAENVTLGRADASAARQALSLVGLDDWLRQQPDGLGTLLGEYPPLSGGQAQRLALARILVFMPDIVLLDEPTAHLSDEEHQALVTLLQNRLRHSTLVWVSHRPLNAAFFNRTWHADGAGRMTRVAA